MKSLKNLFWGVLLIALGVIFALNSLGVTDIDLFFEGWWTLFIIIPSILAFFSEQDKTGPVIGLVVGIALLLSAWDIVDFSTLSKFILPMLLVVAGIRVIVKVIMRSKENSDFPNSTPTPKSYTAAFSGQDLDFDGQVFEGATLCAAFGAIELDLRNAIIDRDIFINATAAFGGIDIYLPNDVEIKVKSSAIFGGVECKRKHKQIDGTHTVYVKAFAAFGGVDVI